MRTWAIACAVFLLLLGALLRLEYCVDHPAVPPGVQEAECLTPPPESEGGWDWLTRLGGHITRYPNAQWQGDAYTVADIAQKRDLSKYDKLVLRDRMPRHPWESSIPVFAQARIFIWQHWRDRQRAYLTLTVSSVDHTGTSHMFVEPDDGGRWRIYWRQLDDRELIEEPTAYWILWVIPQRDKSPSPLTPDQVPDASAHELEFRNLCGEIVRYL